jgi:hypothetical protein
MVRTQKHVSASCTTPNKICSDFGAIYHKLRLGWWPQAKAGGCIRVVAKSALVTTKEQLPLSALSIVSAAASAPALLYPVVSFSSTHPTIMGRPGKKLSTRQGIVSPPTTTTISNRAHNSAHHRSDEDHTTAEPPTKRRWITSSRSTASRCLASTI